MAPRRDAKRRSLKMVAALSSSSSSSSSSSATTRRVPTKQGDATTTTTTSTTAAAVVVMDPCGTMQGECQCFLRTALFLPPSLQEYDNEEEDGSQRGNRNSKR